MSDAWETGPSRAVTILLLHDSPTGNAGKRAALVAGIPRGGLSGNSADGMMGPRPEHREAG